MVKRLINNQFNFCPHAEADEHGIVAISKTLNEELLLNAYMKGIFPWPHEGLPLLWFCPHPRFVLNVKRLKIGRSLRKAINKTKLVIYSDKNFEAVIKNCQKVKRKDQDGTWITNDIMNAYLALHKKGYAHSIEAYNENKLVGGLYGISIGSTFFGESMFTLINNASKIAFVVMAAHLIKWNVNLIDCQSPTNTLGKFGATLIDRKEFLKQLKINNQKKTLLGPWQFSMTPSQSLKMLS